MKRIFIIVAGFLLFCNTFACQQPVVSQTNTDVLWQSSISPTVIYGVFPKFIYKNTIISQGVKNSSLAIMAFDKNSGKELWAWSDFLDGHEIFTDNVHIYENILVWRYANRVYAINLNDGTTVWKERANHDRGWFNSPIHGLGNRFMFHTSNQPYFTGLTTRGQMQKIFPIAVPTLANRQGISFEEMTLFLNAPPNLVPNAPLNDTLVVLPYNTYTHLYFTVYNLTQGKEVFTAKTDTNSGVFILAPTLRNGKLYFPSGRFILCFDLATGKELWREQFTSIFSLSGIIYYDGMIIGNCEDTFMYALDAKTGKQLWATKTSGTSSRLFEMNGVIYFTGGGDGLLHAIDAKTGTHIWKKESPDLQKNGTASFFDSVTGADGKIYVSSYLSLFCYKAAR